MSEDRTEEQVQHDHRMRTEGRAERRRGAVEVVARIRPELLAVLDLTKAQYRAIEQILDRAVES